MGLLGDIKAVGAVQKIKNGGVAKLSVAQIVNLLINIPDAKKKLSSNEFNAVYNLYNDYRKCNTMLPYNMEEYTKTAVKIVRSFDKIAPYEKYCGGNELEYSLFMDELREEEITKDNIHKVLVDLVNNDPTTKGYVNYVIENGHRIDHGEATEFCGLLVLAEKNGVEDALEKLNLLFSDWIEKADDNATIRYMMQFPFFCSLLFANDIVSKEKSDELSKYYHEKLMSKLVPLS